jgi:hypothetical protein
MFRPGQRFESGAVCVRLCHDGFALSIGGVAVVLDRRGAQDVVGALTCALLATVPVDEPPKRSRRKR